MAALGVNCVVGSGIFLLPGPVAGRMAGSGALPAVAATVGAGLLACLIALCFAEAASRFRETGGAYLYAREAFGPLVGFEVGWLAALAGIVAWGALVEGFAVALEPLIPAVAAPGGHAVTIVLFLGLLAALNLRGARTGGALSSAASGVKLLTLVAFAGLGGLTLMGTLTRSLTRGASPPAAAPEAGTALQGLEGLDGWGAAVLLMLYAYVGFENLVVPAGEIDRPEHSLPRAITGVLATVTVLYAGVVAVTAGALPELAGREAAVAVAAERLFGTAGGWLVACGVAVSIAGVNAASALILPRRLSALAERGDLPSALAWHHPRYGTPWPAILVAYGLAGAVALSGSFAELAVLAVLGRLMQYLPTCLAVLVFRRREQGVRRPEPGLEGPARVFRLPGGPALPLLALGSTLLLALQAEPGQLAAGAAAALAGLPVYWWRRRASSSGAGVG